VLTRIWGRRIVFRTKGIWKIGRGLGFEGWYGSRLDFHMLSA